MGKEKLIIIDEKELETRAINFLGDKEMAKDFVKYIKEKMVIK